jgi:hypothetical protein
MSAAAKNKVKPFKDKHELSYGLKIVQRDATTKEVTSVACRFCLTFGREEKQSEEKKEEEDVEEEDVEDEEEKNENGEKDAKKRKVTPKTKYWELSKFSTGKSINLFIIL